MTDDPNMSARDFVGQADEATLRYFRKQFSDIMSLSRMATCSPAINEIATALAKAQAGFETPKKTKIGRVSGISAKGNRYDYTYQYADLEAVYKAVRKPLADNGLAITHLCQEFAGQVELVTMLTHSSGQWLRSVYPVKARAERPQEFGSAMTYAKRYSISALLGIASEEDDDAQSAQEASKEAGRDPALREALEQTNAPPQASKANLGPDLELMNPETGEIEKTWKRDLGGVRDFMRNLEIACQHSSLYWRMNGQEAKALAEKRPTVKVDGEPLAQMITRLDGAYGMQDSEDDPARIMIP